MGIQQCENTCWKVEEKPNIWDQSTTIAATLCESRQVTHQSHPGHLLGQNPMNRKKKAKLIPAINPQNCTENGSTQEQAISPGTTENWKQYGPTAKGSVNKIWEKGFLTHRTHHLNLENVHGHKKLLRKTLYIEHVRHVDVTCCESFLTQTYICFVF